MPAIVRKATIEDAPFLIRIVDIASEGLVPALWDGMAPEGMNGTAVGLSLVTSEDGEFSYRFGFILEREGSPVGGMIGYPLPTSPQPQDADIPVAFVAIEDLVKRVPDHWYINFVALLPEVRGRGLGKVLLNEAEAQARSAGCPGLALIVAATNDSAIRAYARAGYTELARRPFDLKEFGLESTEALLMVKKNDFERSTQ